MEDEEDQDVAVNHVSKRSRYNKNEVVVFDNADRMEYLSGFRKRKEKRRQAAEQQKSYKDRQKRIQDRRERRAALKEAKGVTGVAEEDAPEEEGEDEVPEASTKDISGTSTYEDKETTTVVRVTTILAEDEEDQRTDGRAARRAGGHLATKPEQKLKPGKVKFKKPRKVQSEKRMRKLTRREKSMPKNLRSRRDKKRKK